MIVKRIQLLASIILPLSLSSAFAEPSTNPGGAAQMTTTPPAMSQPATTATTVSSPGAPVSNQFQAPAAAPVQAPVSVPAYQPPRQASNVDADIDDALKIRDPFQKPEKLRSKISAAEELESISVDQIHMVGVVTGPKQTSALITGNGKSFFVTVNTRIGPRKGVVRLITAKGMIIREKIINVIGREEAVDTKIFIEQDPTKRGS